jgi:4-amino-4-deoxy-L-arabinose transferase-like glycosyltransferase
LIIVAYVCVATAYALATPLWEAPDEPAHYNYVRYLIRHQALPVLQQGDYDFQYLERIKAARFPPGMSVDPIRYESHQPPLYYAVGAVLAAPLPEEWRPFALRLLSVLFAACLLGVAYRVVAEIFPGQAVVAFGATAFVATVPMHIALTAAVSNDALAELILGLILLSLVTRVVRPLSVR